MAKYIMLGNWTDQGVRAAKDTVKRAKAVREQFAKLGVNAGCLRRSGPAVEVELLTMRRGPTNAAP